MWISPVYGLTNEEYIRRHHQEVTEELKFIGVVGPMAKEIALFALARQIHEDGLNKPSHNSCVGMYPGGINQIIMKELGFDTKNCPVGYKLGIAHDSDGQAAYYLTGPRANIYGALAVASFFDKMINTKPSVPHVEKRAWYESKKVSSILIECPNDTYHLARYDNLTKDRTKALKRVNRYYGGNAGSVELVINKYQKK